MIIEALRADGDGRDFSLVLGSKAQCLLQGREVGRVGDAAQTALADAVAVSGQLHRRARITGFTQKNKEI